MLRVSSLLLERRGLLLVRARCQDASYSLPGVRGIQCCGAMINDCFPLREDTRWICFPPASRRKKKKKKKKKTDSSNRASSTIGWRKFPLKFDDANEATGKQCFLPVLFFLFLVLTFKRSKNEHAVRFQVTSGTMRIDCFFLYYHSTHSNNIFCIKYSPRPCYSNSVLCKTLV